MEIPLFWSELVALSLLTIYSAIVDQGQDYSNLRWAMNTDAKLLCKQLPSK